MVNKGLNEENKTKIKYTNLVSANCSVVHSDEYPLLIYEESDDLGNEDIQESEDE